MKTELEKRLVRLCESGFIVSIGPNVVLAKCVAPGCCGEVHSAGVHDSSIEIAIHNLYGSIAVGFINGGRCVSTRKLIASVAVR